MIFRGWQKVSYIEYPGKIANVLFTGGCNFRCPYCHNPELVFLKGSLPQIHESIVLEFLLRRKGMVDAVCITGGEPLIHAPDLFPFLEQVKQKGFLIKIDTNGSLFQPFQQIFQAGLADLWGIDYKLPFSLYKKVLGEKWYKNCQSVLDLALNNPNQAEIRTTIYPPFHDEKILFEMAEKCSSANHWYWQNFHPQKTLSDEARTISPYVPSLLNQWRDRINHQIQKDLIVIRPYS
jgi:pyruvate formate lyase activating enzyme